MSYTKVMFRDNYNNRAQNEFPQRHRILIAICGPTGSGKSSLIRGITGREDIKIGHSLYSETDEIRTYDTIINSQPITLVDTPGFDDSNISDLEILKKLAEWLEREHEEGQLLTGLVYMHPITRTRMEGSTLRTLNIIKKLCGGQNLKNVVLVTTFWNDLENQELGNRREKELLESDDFWKTLIESGSKAERMSRDYDRFKLVLVELAGRPVMKLQIQQEMQEGKPLEETMAGLFINDDCHSVWASKEESPEPDEWWSEYLSKLKRESEGVDKRRRQREAEIEEIREKEKQDAARLKRSLELKEQILRGQKAEAERKLKDAAEEQRKKQQYIDKQRAEFEVKQARARREATSKAAYEESLLQRNSVSADVDLFRAAAAAALTRVNAAGINPYKIGMENDGSVTRSGINSWCDRCRQCIGAREVVVCKICPAGLGGLSICTDCYVESDSGRVCMNEDHQLYRDGKFMEDKCRRATKEGVMNIVCDRQDCRRTIKGFYFHCCLCDGDDFDICLQCVMNGRGCRNGTHYLRWGVVPIDIKRTFVY